MGELLVLKMSLINECVVDCLVEGVLLFTCYLTCGLHHLCYPELPNCHEISEGLCECG